MIMIKKNKFSNSKIKLLIKLHLQLLDITELQKRKIRH